MTWELAAVALVALMAPTAIYNASAYAVAFDWRHTREGRAFFTLLVAWAALIVGALLYKFVPAFPGKSVVTFVVYVGILAGNVQTSYSFTRILLDQRRARRRRTD